MLINFTYKEQLAIKELSELQGLTEEQIVRQALRMYQMYIHRIRDGETVHWSGDVERLAKIMGCDVVE